MAMEEREVKSELYKLEAAVDSVRSDRHFSLERSCIRMLGAGGPGQWPIF